MGRPSNREERRRQILGAFARVLAEHGYAGATIAAVAAEANVAPGLLHHHFESKSELLSTLLKTLITTFRKNVAARELQVPAETTGLGKAGQELLAYVDGALGLDQAADLVAARCWVGVLAEAIRNPQLFAQVRRMVDTELGVIQRRSGGKLSQDDAGCVLAFIIGALVLGAFAPRKTAGFAAPGLRKFLGALLAK